MPVNFPRTLPQAPLSAAVKYNPHLWGPEELRAIFVVRTRELEQLLSLLKATPANSMPQHILVTGARGMGKSTLLRRVALGVEDDAELSGQWVALTFPEEQYTVSTLAEFWRNVLDALADTLERQGASTDELAQLDGQIHHIGNLPVLDREAAALDCLADWIATHHRRLLLLIDSTDLLFSGLASGSVAPEKTDATPLWRLRKTLSHQPGIFWLGASYQALESQHQYQDAFMDFFQLVELRPLKLDEMRQAMLALARTFGAGRGLTDEDAVAEMIRNLDVRPERLKGLRTMTGGNPRTTVMLYELFAAGGADDIHSDLRRLLDIMTPLYKARMESLSDQACKLFAHVLEHWAPVSARDLAEISGIAVGTVSGQLSRLEAEGLIEKAQLQGSKRAGFQAAERLFNVWYLMRYASRRLRQRLTWLVEFMRLWYSGEELGQIARHRAIQHQSGRWCDGEQLEYSRAMGLALPDSHDARYQLDFAVYDAVRRIGDQTRQALSELFELDGEDKEFTTAEDYLARFEALDELLGRCPHVTDETRERWVRAVKGSLTLSLARKELIARHAATIEGSKYQTILNASLDEQRLWDKKYGEGATCALFEATLKGNFFPDCPDSKLAYGQIMAFFGEDSVAFCLAVDLFRKYHHDLWLEKAFRHAIKLNPGNAELLSDFCYILACYLNCPQEAESLIRKAVKLDSKNAGILNNLGNLLAFHLNRPQEAEDIYRQAIELNPNGVIIWKNLGNLLAGSLSRPIDAELAYRRAIELDSKNATTWHDFGLLLTDQLNRPQEAEIAYREAIALNPRDSGLWNSLGILLAYYLNRPLEAEEAYRRAIEVNSSYAPAYNNLGKLLSDFLNRSQEAEIAFRKAIESDPKNANIYNNLGNLLVHQLGRPEDAAIAFRKVIELEPNYQESWHHLGNILANYLNLPQEAESAYRNAIALDESDFSTWNNLGNLLADKLNRSNEAEAAYRQAMELDISNPYPTTNLARLLASLGRNDESNTEYRKAAEQAQVRVSSSQGDIQYVELLLQAHLWLGNRDLARLALERLAKTASSGDQWAFFKLREQTRECQKIGIGTALMELMNGCAWADFLQPFSLALAAANSGDSTVLAGVPPEIRSLAEEVLAELQKPKP